MRRVPVLVRCFALAVTPLLLCGCQNAAKDSSAPVHAAFSFTLDFEHYDAGEMPDDFMAGLTGEGGSVKWAIGEDSTAPSGPRVLEQTSTDKAGYRFPLCIYQRVSARNVRVSVAFKPMRGEVDQAAGIVVRCRDENNYYVVRANALENNVRLYKVENGKRKQLAGKDVKVNLGQWQTLAIKAERSHFTVWLDGKVLFEAQDDTFGQAGKIGLWTKADSVTRFDDLRATSAGD